VSSGRSPLMLYVLPLVTMVRQEMLTTVSAGTERLD
jgi:hypothetical protein